MIDDDFFPRDPWTVLREGAAADCADPTDLAKLPRLVRYALIIGNPDAKPRIAAEIAEVSAVLQPGAAAWADSSEHEGWVDLAGGLDAAAVEADRPTLRSLADAVRIASMTMTDVAASPADGLRVMAAIRTAMAACADLDVGTPRILCALETMVIGWSYIVAGDVERWTLKKTLAHNEARAIGHRMTRHTRDLMEEKASERRSRETQAAAGTARPAASTGKPVTVPEGHVLVCPPIDTKSNSKLRDAIKGHEHVVGVALPLAPMPDVAAVRRELVAEFPYAVDTVDALVRPLVGRTTVFIPPVIIVGAPGCGKSRLARRIAEVLGVGVWRTDGSSSSGASFGGLERRWFSAEPAHPFLGISRLKIANPLVLIDEIEKAPSRQDYGRLWDAALGLLEPETASRYPDPCLQVDLDLRHVSYVATANSLLPLPSPLLDRFKVVEMPEPTSEDMDALLPSLLLGAARDQGLDERWAEPLSTDEKALLASKWKGGSVRRLRAYLGVVLRVRDRERRRH